MGSLISILMMSRTVQFAGLAAMSYAYIVFTPFTKVEESFGMQAIHDFIYLGIPRALDIANKLANGTADWHVGDKFPLHFTFSSEPVNIVHSYNFTGWRWDHEDFPGPIPRTFIGPFVISLFTFPWSLYQRTPDKLFVQLVVRMILATFVLVGFYTYACAVKHKFGRHTTSALAILTLSQFHFLFYASRPLPNTFALSLVLFASAKWLSRRYTSFIILVAMTVIIFRSETAILFAPMILQSIFCQKNLSIIKLFIVGIPAGLVCLSATVLFDSFMWQKWVWPEGYGLYFNVYLNKSADWGVKPFFWYFYSALPRSLLFSFIFVPFASKRCIKTCFSVSVAFVFLYSFLGHKELRFIIYCLPLLNTCAANAIAITGYRFFTCKPHPESWLGHFISKRLGFKVTADEEFEAQEKLMDDREKIADAREAEKRKPKFIKPVKKSTKAKLPDQYDAITPSHILSSSTSASNPSSSSTSSVRRRGGSAKVYTSDEVEDVLDEKYSKITAAVFEQGKDTTSSARETTPAQTLPARTTIDDLPEPDAAYLTTVVLVIMALHIWVNIGCLVYMSVASWHNYPGGDAVNWTNERLKATDLKTFRAQDIAIYVCNLAAQTGFTRFLQINGITYDKSPDYSIMASKSKRIAEWRSSNNPNLSLSRVNQDFKVIYFILENIDVNFLTKYCSTSRLPRKSKKVVPATIRLSDSIDSVTCKLSQDMQDCTLVKAINGFDGIDLSRAPKSIFILTVPKLWIFRCGIK